MMEQTDDYLRQCDDCEKFLTQEESESAYDGWWGHICKNRKKNDPDPIYCESYIQVIK